MGGCSSSQPPSRPVLGSGKALVHGGRGSWPRLFAPFSLFVFPPPPTGPKAFMNPAVIGWWIQSIA